MSKNPSKRTRMLAGFALALAPLQAFAGLTAILGADFDLSTMKTEAASVASRSMNVIDFRCFLGWKLGPIALGPAVQYRVVNQLTDPAEVGNVNLMGAGYLAGVGAAIYLGPIFVQGSYEFFGQHKLGTQSASSLNFTYSSPSGFTARVGYLIQYAFSLDLNYSAHSFGAATLGTVTNDIAGDKLTESAFGLGLSVHL